MLFIFFTRTSYIFDYMQIRLIGIKTALFEVLVLYESLNNLNNRLLEYQGGSYRQSISNATFIHAIECTQFLYALRTLLNTDEF